MELQIVVLLQAFIFFILDSAIYIRTIRNGRNNISQKYFSYLSFFATALMVTSMVAESYRYGIMDMSLWVINLNYIFMMLFFAMASYWWFEYLFIKINPSMEIGVKLHIIHQIPIFLMTIAAFGSPKYHWLFYIDPVYGFQKGNLFFLQILFPYLYVIASLIITFKAVVKGRINRAQITLIYFLSFLIPSMIGACVQAVHPASYTQIGVSIGVVLMYLELYVEELTENQRLQSLAEVNENLQQLNNQLIEERKIEEENNAIIRSLANSYRSVYYIDLQSNTYKSVSAAAIQEIRQSVPNMGTASQQFETMLNSMVAKEHIGELEQFVNLSTLSERLSDRNSIGIHFINKYAGWCEGLFVCAQRNENSECTHVIWAIRTIQEEKEADEAQRQKLIELTEQQHKQLQLVETLSRDYLNVYIIHPKTKRTRVLKMKGYKMGGLIQPDIQEYDYDQLCEYYISNRIAPEDEDRMRDAMKMENVEKALNMDGRYVGVYQIEENDELHHYQYKYARIVDSEEIVVGFQNVDDTFQQQLEEQQRLESALLEAKKANQAKSAFLSRMSHDIRTPLNGIIGLIEINEKHADNRELVDENRAKAKVAANHLLSLISDVLDLSKMEDENVSLAHEPFNIIDLSKDVLTIARLRANESGIRLNVDGGDKYITYPYVFGSPLHVRQIFVNILSNAIKYNKQNGSITCLATMSQPVNGKVNYCVTIEDTGIGMNEDFIKRIFEPFSQEHSDARSTYQGTGLGMSIVKSLVDKMGGTIEVSSKVNVGSRFVITIPFEIASQKDIPVQVQADCVDLNGLKILLVEDNELNLEIAQTILEDAGAVISTAQNGKEGFESFINHPVGTYDVILMDLMMPIMDGYEATKAIREYNRADAGSIPIVAMTANAFTEDAQKCLSAGMTGHLAKPINIPTLMKTLTKIKSS